MFSFLLWLHNLLLTDARCIFCQNPWLLISARISLLLVGVQFKTSSLLKSLHTLDWKLTVTSTTSLRVMNPPISQVKAWSMLYFPLNTRSLGRFFGSQPYFLVPIHIHNVPNQRTLLLSIKTLQSLVVVMVAISKMYQICFELCKCYFFINCLLLECLVRFCFIVRVFLRKLNIFSATAFVVVLTDDLLYKLFCY